MKNSNTNKNTKVRTLTVMTALLLVIIFTQNIFAQQQITSYDFRCNNIPSNDNARSIVNRIDTGYAIAGFAYHPICAIGPMDWMWIQLRANGTVSQSRYIGTQFNDQCNSLVQDQGDRSYTMAGYMFDPSSGRNKATLVDLNSVGNFNYSRWIFDTLSSAYSQVVIDQSRTTGFTGHLEKAVGNKVRSKLLCSQYSPAGVMNWAYRYDSWLANLPSPSTEEGKSLCYQQAGNCYGVVARTNFYSKSNSAWNPLVVKLDYSGNVIWQKVYRFNIANPNYYPSADPTKIIPMTDGGFAVLANTNSIFQNGSHMLVFRVSSTGALMWAGIYGTTAGSHYGNSMVLDGQNIVVTGRRLMGNSQDAIMMKIPAVGGNPLWTRVWNPTANSEAGFDIIRSNQSTASFGYAVTGDVSINSGDAFLWRTNANGLLDSSTCNNSAILERIVPEMRLDSFKLVKVQKYCKSFTPEVMTTNYRHARICLGTFASMEENTVESDNPNTTEEITDYKLSQNFPNPFNPSTTINFQVPVDGNVSVKVYDVSGKQVAELINAYRQRGSYSIQFNASDLPTGAYYYKIETNEFTDVKKMLLIK